LTQHHLGSGMQRNAEMTTDLHIADQGAAVLA
jgi:hypothetical protein